MQLWSFVCVDVNALTALKIMMHLLPLTGKKRMSAVDAFSRLFHVVAVCMLFASYASMLLVGRQVEHSVCKKNRLGAGMVICLGRGADLHMAQLMSLSPTVSCSSKIQIGFTFLVQAYPGCPGKKAVKRM